MNRLRTLALALALAVSGPALAAQPDGYGPDVDAAIGEHVAARHSAAVSTLEARVKAIVAKNLADHPDLVPAVERTVAEALEAVVEVGVDELPLPRSLRGIVRLALDEVIEDTGDALGASK